MVPLVAEAGFAWMATDEEILGALAAARPFARDADLYRAYQVGDRDGARWRAASAIICCRTSSASPTRRGIRQARRRRLRPAHRRQRRALPRAPRRGRGRRSSSCSTGRTPGSTTRARGGRFCGRCIGRLERAPVAADRDDGRGLRRRHRAPAGASIPGRGSTPTSTSGSAMPTIGAPGASCRARAARSSTPPARPAPRRWPRPARSCSSPKAATGAGGTATTTTRITTASSTICSAATSATSIARSALPIPDDLFVTNITTDAAEGHPVAADGADVAADRRARVELLRVAGSGRGDAVGRGRRDAPGGRRRPAPRPASASASGPTALCLHVQTAEPLTESLAQGGELTVAFLEPAGTRIAVNGAHRGGSVLRRTSDGTWLGASWRDLEAAVDAVAELRIPFERLGLREHDALDVRRHAAAVVTRRGRVHADRGDDGARTGHRTPDLARLTAVTGPGFPAVFRAIRQRRIRDVMLTNNAGWVSPKGFRPRAPPGSRLPALNSLLRGVSRGTSLFVGRPTFDRRARRGAG